MSFIRSFFGADRKREAKDINTALDMVTYAASLVSNPDEIDPTLDRVRAISASLNPGQPVSPSDTQALFDVYLQIEAHLATKEVIRTFTAQDLRAKFSPQIRQQLEAYITDKKEG